MLVLTRKLMEKLYIGDDICVTVVRLEGGQVRLGIDAPRDVAVVRGELIRPRPPAPHSDHRSHPGPRMSIIHNPRLVESITDAADGFDEIAGFAEFLPEALDVNVNRAFQHDRVFANRGVHELESGERPASLT
jgi:carbon storage regulator CsrA